MSRLPRPISLPLAASAAAAACLLLPAGALADVTVSVPPRYLGGATAPPAPLPGSANAPDTEGRPAASPVGVADGCAGEAPSDCMFWDDRAEIDPRNIVPDPAGGPLAPPIVQPPPGEEGDGSVPPLDDLPGPPIDRPALVGLPAVPAAAPPPDGLTGAYGRLLSPGAAAWLPWQTPTLRWKTTRRADYYNVQVFRGARRVPTSRSG